MSLEQQLYSVLVETRTDQATMDYMVGRVVERYVDSRVKQRKLRRAEVRKAIEHVIDRNDYRLSVEAWRAATVNHTKLSPIGPERRKHKGQYLASKYTLNPHFQRAFIQHRSSTQN